MAIIQAVDSGPTVGQLFVIMIGSITILSILAYSAVKIFGPIAQAYARRLNSGAGGDGEVVDRIDALTQDLEQVRGQLAETQERLDFTERLLSQGRAAGQVRDR